MNRDRVQFWLAATLAVTAHVALFVTGSAVKERGWGYGSVAAKEKSPTVDDAPPVVTVEPVEPPPPERDLLGETGGKGEAISSVDAPEPAKAKIADDLDQAWTRQQPMPLPTRGSDAETQEAQAVSDAAPKREAPSLGPMTVTGLGAMQNPKPPAPEAVSPNDAPTQPDPETTTDGKSQGTAKEPRPAEKPVDDPKPETTAATATPTVPSADPDPAEKGKSDLDAFAKEEGMDYTRGGMEARGGREVKLRRPRIDLGFMADATQLPDQDIVVKLQIETDASGHPRRVEIAETSGSTTIDDAVRLAAYDSWFGGKMPDRFPFVVRFMRR